jgi:hypothetical protein
MNIRTERRIVAASLFAAAWALTAGVLAQTGVVGLESRATAESAAGKRPYSPWAERAFPTRPLFGDTHVHTADSFDAGAFGARLSARDAIRFAKGEELTSSTGQRVKL